MKRYSKKEFLMKLMLVLICSFLLFSANSFAASVKKVKGKKVLISLDGLGDLKKNDIVLIITIDGEIKGRVKKKGKKSALIIVKKDATKISKGDEVSLKNKSNKTSNTSSKSSQNSLYLEPILGYSYGLFSQDISATSPTSIAGLIEGNSVGFSGGMGITYVFNNYFVSGRSLYSTGSLDKVTLKLADSITNVDSQDFTKNSYGINLGRNIGKNIKGWLGFLFDSHEAKMNDSTDISKGTTIVFGFGYSLKNEVSIILEGGLSTYTELNGIKYPSSTTSSGITIVAQEQDETYVLVGVSYRFKLL
jgi:hypothetical protein